MNLREELTYGTRVKNTIKRFHLDAIPKWCTSVICFLWVTSVAAIIADINIKPIIIPLFQIHGLPVELSFCIDRLTLLMMCAVTMISLFVHQYSIRYLKFDTEQNRFMLQLSLVTVAVLFFVFSGNLLTAFIGWQLIGFSLYLLLNHYHYEAEANRSAKKKFIINRIGDLCFLTAVIVCYKAFGTSEFGLLLQQGTSDTSTLILGLLFVAVMTKTAQFPFHIWLPDTMQTPTPVSALMHAGVINSGGILLAKLSPWLIQNQLVMQSIFWVGFITMAIGALVMRKQPDIKKKLAYSTMSQMGYMIMQCGIGSFALAIFHLMMHGFYKSSQFMNAGEVSHTKSIVYRESNRFNDVILSMAMVAIIATCTLFVMGAIHNPIYVIFMMALAAVCTKTIYRHVKSPRELFYSLAAITLAMLVYIGLSYVFESFLSGVVTNMITVNGLQIAASSILAIAFIALSDKPVSPVYQRKLSLEKIYRTYLLAPFRKCGEIINNRLVITTTLVGMVTLATLILSLSPYRDATIWAMIFATVIGSNNASTPTRFIALVTLSQLGVLALLTYNSEQFPLSFITYYLVTTAAILLPILLISRTRNVSGSYSTEIKNVNKLTHQRFYFAVCAMLLIGAPGSAMLVNELGIFSSFYQLSFTYIALYATYLLFLTISVLHALQYFVFNKSVYLDATSKLHFVYHVIFITAILFNIISGIYPFIQLGA